MAKVEKGKSGKGATPKSSAKKEAAVPEISQDSGNEHQFAPRLRETYREQVVPALMKEFSYGNLMQVPRLERIVLNVGMGEAIQNVKLLESASNELGIITGQKPVTTRAKKAIAGFKLRQGMPIGAKVTLRSRRMWEFLDRLISLALPRIRDFRGISPIAVGMKRDHHMIRMHHQQATSQDNRPVKNRGICLITDRHGARRNRRRCRIGSRLFRNAWLCPMRPGKGLQRDAAKKQAPHRRARRPTPETLLCPFFPAIPCR